MGKLLYPCVYKIRFLVYFVVGDNFKACESDPLTLSERYLYLDSLYTGTIIKMHGWNKLESKVLQCLAGSDFQRANISNLKYKVR